MASAGSVVASDDTDMFVFTRFGIGVTDEDWLATRLRLFEAITLPSLLAQTDQRFRWVIFVGPEANDWVTSKLTELCAPLGDRVYLVKSILRPAEIRSSVLANRRGSHMITGLIDDDDAWHVQTVAWARSRAASIRAEGIGKFGFTFPSGYEWLISDLLDVDKLVGSGQRVVRPSAAYRYVRPYLGTSCFTFSRHEDCFHKIGGMHASVGANLAELGFASRLLDTPEPAWLYVRHHQADSAIHKARSEDAVDASLATLAATFGIDERLVRAYQAEASSIPYAAKRTHKRVDKSKLTFDAGAVPPQEVRVEPGNAPIDARLAGRLNFNPSRDHGLADSHCRIAIFDNRAKQFCLLKEVPSSYDFILDSAQLPSHGDCKYKVQVRIDGRWVDRVGYRPLPAPATEEPIDAPRSSQALPPPQDVSDNDFALHSMDLQLLQSSSLFDVTAADQRKASNQALFTLFLRLNGLVAPDVIFEIGACDATFSCQVRKRVPGAQIYAFEANPHNYTKFKSHPNLRDSRVQYLHLAVSDRAGEVSFFIQKSRAGKAISLNTGSNSMLERMGDVEQERITVPATSIAEFTAEKRLGGTFSAWVDVEGATKNALRGMGDRLSDFALLLVEVEERAHWKEQWLWFDVLRFLTARGLVPVARDFEYTTQHNVVFVRRHLLLQQDIRRALAEHYSSLRGIASLEPSRVAR